MSRSNNRALTVPGLQKVVDAVGARIVVTEPYDGVKIYQVEWNKTLYQSATVTDLSHQLVKAFIDFSPQNG